MTSNGDLRPVLETSYEMFTRSKARGTDASAGVAFDPATSALAGRAIFLVGAPRSGTTWLQQLLALHPDIATAGEMHVFCEGVAPLFDNHAGTDDYSGLSGWVTRPELVGLVRSLVDGIMLRLRDTMRPAATHVLDKTPNHVPYARLLAEVYPDATFVQIIRDGRDAAASAQQMFSGFGTDYRGLGGNAARWRDAVEDCRRHLADLNYVEVRYEDLLADAPAGLRRIYDAAGLRHDDAFLSECTQFAAVPINVRPSKAGISARKYDLPRDAEWEIFDAAGDLLVDLGYVDAAHVAQVLSRRSPRRIARDVAGAGRGAFAAGQAKVRRRYGAEARGRAARRRVGAAARTLSDALAAGDAPVAAAALAPAVTVQDGTTVVTGAEAVAAHLVSRVAGLREVAFVADESTAGVRWSDGAGDTQMHQVQVDGSGRVARVVVSSSR